MLEYYNTQTQTLTLPYNFTEELKDIPVETTEIIFGNDMPKTGPYYQVHVSNGLSNKANSLYDRKIRKGFLPITLTRLIFGQSYNQEI